MIAVFLVLLGTVQQYPHRVEAEERPDGLRLLFGYPPCEVTLPKGYKAEEHVHHSYRGPGGRVTLVLYGGDPSPENLVAPDLLRQPRQKFQSAPAPAPRSPQEREARRRRNREEIEVHSVEYEVTEEKWGEHPIQVVACRWRQRDAFFRVTALIPVLRGPIRLSVTGSELNPPAVRSTFSKILSSFVGESGLPTPKDRTNHFIGSVPGYLAIGLGVAYIFFWVIAFHRHPYSYHLLRTTWMFLIAALWIASWLMLGFFLKSYIRLESVPWTNLWFIAIPTAFFYALMGVRRIWAVM